MRAWASIAIGLVVAVLAVLVVPLVQSQKDLRLVSEQIVQARARSAELESMIANLKTELDAANQARTELQGALEEVKSQIEKRQSEIERLTAELEKAMDSIKDAEAPNRQRDSASKPSWQPQ